MQRHIFSDAMLAPFRADLKTFLAESNITPDWSIRKHRSMCRNILRHLNEIMPDPDQALLKSLIDGVGTGFPNDIPLSNCFPLQPPEEVTAPSLSAHCTNWS